MIVKSDYVLNQATTALNSAIIRKELIIWRLSKPLMGHVAWMMYI